MKRYFAINETVSSKDVISFIKDSGLSRRQAAALFNVSIKTINYWAINDKEISGPIVLLLSIIKNKPELIDYYRVDETKYPLRLYYMSGNDISTIIDVDLLNGKVKFRNYTDNVIKRAFGRKESVSYNDFENFLKSRCFPEERDMMSIELARLKLPMYDPLLIVEKTEGRTAEDDYWLKIERAAADD